MRQHCSVFFFFCFCFISCLINEVSFSFRDIIVDIFHLYRMPYRSETNTENDDSDVDPGREVIERNTRARLQRVANHTRDELNKVLQRVDHVRKSI